MQIQINTLESSSRFQEYFSNELRAALSRFSDSVTRVEVHLGDENGEKYADDDKRCMIEVRLAGMTPVAATNHADTLEKAFQGAVVKLKTLLSKLQDKQKEH